MDKNTKIFTSLSLYADTDVCRWNISQLNYLALLNFQFENELVANVPAVFHWPCPYDQNFEDKISELYLYVLK
jgi:hypothetical protein